jgi:hypothetical protein
MHAENKTLTERLLSAACLPACCQGSCETEVEVGEFLDILWSLIFIAYYTWLLNSLIVELQFEANGGAGLKQTPV